jgi:hypothetical protein
MRIKPCTPAQQRQLGTTCTHAEICRWESIKCASVDEFIEPIEDDRVWFVGEGLLDFIMASCFYFNN